MEYLRQVRRKIGRRAILIPTTDRTTRFVATHAEALKGEFIFPKQSAELVDTLSSKQGMYQLARRYNIPTPEAVFPKSREEVLSFLDRARFPIMLKGIDGQRLWDRTGRKMFIVRSEQELLERYEAAEDFANPNLMLQEYIPGGDDTVWMFNGYFNERSECLAAFTGKKIRQCPVYTGSTSLGTCLQNEVVKNLTLEFMQAIGYRGILDIGYRYDARDGQYRVLDANPRIGATFRLFVGQNGMDVARALYLDLTGQEVVFSPARDGRKWIAEDLDLVSCFRYRCDGKLTLREWIRSFRGVEEAAFLSRDDPMPVFLMGLARVRELLHRVSRAARARLRCLAEKSQMHFPAPPAQVHKKSDFLSPVVDLGIMQEGAALNHATSNYPAKQRYWGTIAEGYNQWRLGSPVRRLVWGREFRLLEKIVRDQLAPNSTILDAPTGTGRFLPLFRDLGHKVTGIDISADMLKVQAGLRRGSNTVLLQGDCEHLPFRDGAFDYIVSLRFMGHVPPEIRVRVLQEFRRVAARGIIAGFPVLNPLTGLKFGLGNLRYKLKNGKPRPWWPGSPQSLARELERAGLAIAREVKFLGPFSQIVFLYLTQADSRKLRAETVGRQVHLVSA